MVNLHPAITVIPIIIQYEDWTRKEIGYERKLSRGSQVTETITEVKQYINGQEVKSDNSTPKAKSTESQAKPTSEAAADSSASSSDEGESNDDFANQALKAHNSYRRKHGVNPLKLSPNLCNFAMQWAQKLANEDQFYHRPSNNYGENIYMSFDSNPNVTVSGSDPVQSWYSEIKDHTFGVEPRSMNTGHFTQVVWKTTKNLGIAMAKSRSGKTIVVANYEPAGNFIGSYANNVPPPQ
ncbi:hypothetical protein TCAL_09712 [Tigriopus californicus]|uniref:SCP domain-containing protein n=2 Tax=Tigriopus californicus TaxID=6832 RepID=A0A553P3Z6_TIGCA|nr:Golgi-associated plant pathogenesis-related protein 1-like isoform X2 [Tigriopus californicus]TRY72370.1 hypothetical protein TCAL_09712 [Tigriopus californicus]